jgi:hypothetical protein
LRDEDARNVKPCNDISLKPASTCCRAQAEGFEHRDMEVRHAMANARVLAAEGGVLIEERFVRPVVLAGRTHCQDASVPSPKCA